MAPALSFAMCPDGARSARDPCYFAPDPYVTR